MRVASLGSGSKGNATIVQHGATTLMIDCGFSLRQCEQRIQRLGIQPDAIDAILVTHEHSDHSAGVERLSRQYGIPVWTTVGTARAVFDSCLDFHRLAEGTEVVIGDIRILPVTVPHDANEPLQFIFEGDLTGKRFGILTDAGHITSHMIRCFSELDGLLLEFNYDEAMLEAGPYPPMLKQRVSGRHGHLSNDQSVELLEAIERSNLRCLIAAHISEKNNTPEVRTRGLTGSRFNRLVLLFVLVVFDKCVGGMIVD